MDHVVGLDAEAELLYVVTKSDQVLAVDLVGGRADTVATNVVRAVLGADGTLYTIDRARAVVTLRRRVRRQWSDTLPAVPRDVFGTADQRLVAVVPGERPRLVTAAADRPATTAPLAARGDAAATPWADVLAVAGDSGVLLVDPQARREPVFVPLPDHPRALAFSPSGHRLYVGRRGAPGLAAIDRFTRTEIDGVALPGAAAAVRFDPLGRWLLAAPAQGDTAWVVDLPTKRLVGGVPTAWAADLPALAPDGSLIVRQAADVVALTPDSLTERGRAAGGAADRWILSAWRPRGMPAPVAVAVAESISTEGPLYVQVSVSQNAAWAEENALQITRAGLPARVLPPESIEDGYRVVLGPYRTRGEAEAIGRKLGRPFWIYQPGVTP